jgi:hypothetical protein
MALGLGYTAYAGHTLTSTAAGYLHFIDAYRLALAAAAGLTDLNSRHMWPATATFWNEWTNEAIAGNPGPPSQGFPATTLMDGLCDRGIVPLIFNVPQSGTTPDGDGVRWFDLEGITAGHANTYLDAYAASAVAYRDSPARRGTTLSCQPKSTDIIFRWGHEMNAAPAYFPWQTGNTSPVTTTSPNTAADYIAAWRYIYNRLVVTGGADNLKFFWCPIGGNAGTVANFSTFYPGDGYVDYVGWDAYSQGTTNWQQMHELYIESYNKCRSIAPTKDIIIGETAYDGVTRDDVRQAAWITNGLADIASTMPKIKVLAYYDINQYSFYADHTHALSLTAWANGANTYSAKL